MIDEPPLTTGYAAQELAAEFPDLRLVYTVVDGASRRSPEEVRERLRVASNRFTAAKALALRQQPIPWAYRVFFRHIGIDPDQQRTPIEAIAVERMRAGGFRSHGQVEDALLLGTLETGVPLLAFDADALEGRVRIRLAAAGEELDPDHPLAGGEIVIADEPRPLTVLFGDGGRTAAVGRPTARIVVAAIQVAGVPPVSVEEAIWVAVETLSGDTS